MCHEARYAERGLLAAMASGCKRLYRECVRALCRRLGRGAELAQAASARAAARLGVSNEVHWGTLNCQPARFNRHAVATDGMS